MLNAWPSILDKILDRTIASDSAPKKKKTIFLPNSHALAHVYVMYTFLFAWVLYINQTDCCSSIYNEEETEGYVMTCGYHDF